jgi:hypothetical protein
MLACVRISIYTNIDTIVSMAKMTEQEIATIIESVADGKATFDEGYVLGLYSASEMEAYLAWVVA